MRRTVHGGHGAALVMVAVVAACSANVNGRPIAFGGPTAAGPQPASAEGDGAAGTADRGPSDEASMNGGAAAGLPPASSCRAQQWADAWPYLDRPADPWLAVVEGRPARVSLPTDRTGMIGSPGAICDAAHDHCLRDCTWLVTQSTGYDAYDTQATPYHVDAEGTFRAARDQTQTPVAGFVAYRTVPVTRANLRVGAFVMAVPAPAQDAGGRHWSSGSDPGPLGAFWETGKVASIDWDGGTLRIEGRREPYFLSATRLAVLRYTDGGKVETIAGVDTKPPLVADVIGPGRKATVSDPWSAVGRDGQPIASSDDTTLSGFNDDCGGRADHCLRPWVWFVDGDGHEPQPARWTGTRFVRADAPDSAIERHGVAYRTRPATAADLTPGLRVILYDRSPVPRSQLDAHAAHVWTFVEVDTIDRGAGTFIDRDHGNRHAIDSARVLVLYWLAGDKAAKVE